MAWIESHQSLATHKKTKSLKRLLHLTTVQAIGHLHLLWYWCLDNAPDGDLAGIDPKDIAEVMEWHGDPDKLVKALRDAGWLDPDEKIHDWWDYAGKLIDQRKSNASRQKAFRERKIQERNSDITVTLPLRNAATVPNRTQPYPTQPNSTSIPPVAPQPEKTAGGAVGKNNTEETGLDNSVEIPVAQVEPGTDNTEQDPKLTAMVICYEQNIGMPTPLIADELKLLSSRFSPEWFAAAVKEACGANARRLNYVKSVLERWEVDGFQSKRKTERNDLYNKNRITNEERLKGLSSDPKENKFLRGPYGHMVQR